MTQQSSYTTTQQSPYTTTPSPVPSSTSTADAATWVSDHNNLRTAVGVGPVSWNNTIAQGATQYAAQCQFQHSTGCKPYVQWGRIG